MTLTVNFLSSSDIVIWAMDSCSLCMSKVYTPPCLIKFIAPIASTNKKIGQHDSLEIPKVEIGVKEENLSRLDWSNPP
jgi:hypothetical protein